MDLKDFYTRNQLKSLREDLILFGQTLLRKTIPSKKATKKSLISALGIWFIIVSSGLIYLFNPFTPKASATWFNDNFTYRTALNFTHNASVTTPTKVKFDIDTATLTTDKLQADCGDSRFTDANGKLLRYFIDTAGGACDGASTDYYVLIPTIVNGSNTIYHYYGNPSAQNGTEPAQFSEATTTPSGSITTATEEKSPGPAVYWKMDEGYGGTIQDSTTNNLDAVSSYTGDGADGAVTFSSNFNLNTTAARSCLDDATTHGATLGWAPIYLSTANTAAGSTTLALTTSPAATCLAAGDEVLIINLMGATDELFDLGRYETKTISSISTDTLTFVTGLTNGYEGSTRKIMVVRIPNFTTVSVADTITLTGLDFDSTAGGVIFFRATGAVTLNTSGIISANGLGYIKGAGGTTAGTAGFTGDSYDGAGDNTNAINGTGENNGGDGTAGDAGNRGGGGGGGKANTVAGSGSGGGGGGSYGGGGGGGAGGNTNASGGSGGAINVPAGGGGGTGAATGAGGNAGSDGGAGSSGVSGGESGSGGATGQGGGSGANSGGGGGGGGLYGSSSLSNQIFMGSGGGGGGARGTTAGVDGGDGGGIIMISASSFTSFGSGITTNGNVGTDATGSRGAGGGGAGGSVLINSNSSLALGSNLITATGGAGGAKTTDGGGGGSGGVGRININNPLSGTTNPTYSSPATTWQTEDYCVAGKCLSFDAENDILSTPDSPALDFAAADNFTVSGWVKRNGASSAINYILTKADTTNGGYKLWMDADGDLCFGIDDDSSWGPDISACSSNANFDDDKWHFVSGVRSVTDDKVYVYVDGIQKDSQTDPTTATLANTNALYIGADRDGSSNLWKGFIDDVKVYSDQTGRSATQVAADFNSRGGNKGAAEVLGANSQNQPAVLSNSLVGYWKVDGYWDNAGSLNDLIDTSGNNITLTNVSVQEAIGKFGGGGDFESGSSTYQYAADTASLSITGSLTLAAWIKPESVSAGTWNILGKWDGSNESYRLMQNADEIRLEIDSDGNYVETTASNLTAGTWYHVVGVYDSTTATARVYINGALATTATTGTIPSSIGDDAGKFHIGAEDTTTTAANFYDGIIDEARVYNRALSAGDIRQLADWGPKATGDWNFDDKTGTVANDLSGNGNSGVLTNSPTWTSGRYGSALNFTGSDAQVVTTNVKYATVHNSYSNFADEADFTFSAWIKHDTASSAQTILSDNYAIGYRMVMQSDGDISCNLDFDTNLSITDSEQALSTAATYDDNKWHHVACVKTDGTSLALYIDGVLIATDSSLAVDNKVRNSAVLLIGIDADRASNDWVGQIDEVKIYNYARTGGQVVEDMNAGHPAPGSPVGSPTGYWKFDEGAENTCSGGTNDVCNSGNSGNTYDGTSTATRTNSGKFSRALNFDGSDDVVTITNANAIDMDTGLVNHTFSGWIYPETDGEGDVGQIYQKGTSTYLRVDSQDGSNNLDLEANIDLATTDANVNIADAFLINTWNHVATTWDGTTLKVFINGKQRGSGTGSGAISADTNNLLIGGTTTANFDGTIDDFKVYNSALTVTQIALDANIGSASVQGALSDNSSYQVWGANQEYCVPGDSTSCASPVGEWHLNEKTGTNTFDTSGNGNDLTLTNTPTWTTGKLGAAVNFAGSNQHLIRADDADFDFAGAGSFVLSAWIKHNASPGTQEEIISKFATQGYKLLMETDGDITCTITDDAAQTDSATSTAATYDDNKWHHIACVKNASTSLTLYIDGAQVVQDASIAATSTLANTDPIYVGIDEDATSEDWVGQIDEVRIFNYARTGAQVAWDYNRGGPVGWWKLDDCQGTTAYDNSVTNTNNGTVTIGATGTNDDEGNCTTVDTTTAWYNGRTGKMNYSLDFDGTDDVVTVTNATSIDLNDNLASSHSFSAWIYAGSDGEGDTGQVYYKGANTYLRVDTESGSRVDVEASLDLATTPATVNVSSAIAINSWNHIVVIYTDDGDDEIDVYINGALRGSSTNGSGAPTAEAENLLIGGTTTANFDGQIDDVRVYNYALTATQIKTVMNNGAAVRYGPVTGSP